MFINPMDSIGSIGNYGIQYGSSNTIGNRNSKTGKESFVDVFAKAVDDVRETDAKVVDDVYKLSTGQTDDTHTLSIDSTKAQMSLNLLIQLRNKTMDSYNELMRINL